MLGKQTIVPGYQTQIFFIRGSIDNAAHVSGLEEEADMKMQDCFNVNIRKVVYKYPVLDRKYAHYRRCLEVLSSTA